VVFAEAGPATSSSARRALFWVELRIIYPQERSDCICDAKRSKDDIRPGKCAEVC
jgi:hypothetical protein